MNAPAADGVIKYHGEHHAGSLPQGLDVDELLTTRTALFDLGLVGAYPDGVGYGNLSVRGTGDQFAITGSGTGALRALTRSHFALVESFSIPRNRVVSRGEVQASSESMTHGTLYACRSDVQCVMHVHSRVLFDALLGQGMVCTPADVPYGTPAMARCVAALATAQAHLPFLFVMAGHDEGLVAVGADVRSTLALLVETLQRTLAQ